MPAAISSAACRLRRQPAATARYASRHAVEFVFARLRTRRRRRDASRRQHLEPPEAFATGM